MIVFYDPLEFEWDKGNIDKNYLKHSVTNQESEEVFFDIDKKIFRDPFHSGNENRYILVGKTNKKRVLFIVFTIRKRKARIISARDLNKRERGLYEK